MNVLTTVMIQRDALKLIMLNIQTDKSCVNIIVLYSIAGPNG